MFLHIFRSFFIIIIEEIVQFERLAYLSFREVGLLCLLLSYWL